MLIGIGASFSKFGLPGDTSSGMCFANMLISINPLEDSFTATCSPANINDDAITSNCNTAYQFG